MKTLSSPGEQIISTISRIYNNLQTSTSGGNISIMDENGDMYITPSQIDKGSLKLEDIVCVKKNGEIIGKHKPSSEYPFHKAIYLSRKDIKAVIHAHPPGLVAFSIVRKTPNINAIAHSQNVCGKVGYAKYELPSSESLGKVIADEFNNGAFSVIMENHGVVLGGKNMDDAYQRFENLESLCLSLIYANEIGTPHFLSEDEIQTYQSAMVSDFDEDEMNLTENENQVRNEICNILQRSCRQGLMTSAFGCISFKINDDEFLTTPANLSIRELEESDIVKIKNGKCEKGKHSNKYAKLHRQIFNQDPSIDTIITTQSTSLMAFAISHEEINVRTIPESWIFLQDIKNLPFESLFDEKETILKALSKNRSVIINNDSFTITGKELIKTFDYLEVAEFSAKSLVLSSSLGNLVPINDEQVKDLERTFLG